MNHEKYIQRCFELAKNGLGHTQSNPLVGAVIVWKDQIIGEGYHAKYGEAHAEVHAIASVKNQSRLKESTIYVNLEPCCHTGKTPPCADLIIEKKIPKVVVCNVDPYAQVNGGGIEKLKAAGVEVVVGILKEQGRLLNRRFFTFHEKKRPFVILKWAQTKDGFIDRLREGQNKMIHWITQPETKSLTHRWRSQESAILVGWKTVRNDNPSLTTRAVKGANPLRCVLDLKLALDYRDFKIGTDDYKTIVFNYLLSEEQDQVDYIRIDSNRAIWPQIFFFLHSQGKISLIVEGGGYTLQSLIDEMLWDEARILNGQNYFVEGVKAPRIQGSILEEQEFFGDHLTIFKPI